MRSAPLESKRDRSIDSALWVTTVAGGVLGVLLVVIGFVLLSSGGAGILVAGLLILAVGVGAHFVRTGRSRS